MSRNCTYLVLAAMLASLTGISGAVAAEQWPASAICINGKWYATANQTGLVVDITSQGPGPGQPNGAKCPAISGTITRGAVIQKLSGFYCPDSGRIGFSRIPATGPITQVYSANLSEISASSSLLLMGGNYQDQNLGEYSFQAQCITNPG